MAIACPLFSCHVSDRNSRNSIISDSLSKRNRDCAFYNYAQCEKRNAALEKENLAQQKLITIFVMSSAVLLLSLIILFFFQRQHQMKLKRMVDSLNEELERLKSLEEGHTYFEEKQYPTGLRIANSEVCKKLKTVVESDGKDTFLEWQSLADIVSDMYPTFHPNLLKLKKMSSIELKVCLLLKIGIAIPDVSKIICRSQDTVYSICRRLYKKNFEDSPSAKKWKDFIQTL